jgi:lipopolysaccharide transport system ATP-binding protein
MEFQKKCLGKMSAVAKAGRTVLFVSHNMPAVSALCDWAVMLESGQVKRVGDVASVVQSYFTDKDQGYLFQPADTHEDFILSKVKLESITEEGKARFFYSEDICIGITFVSRTSSEWPRGGITLRDSAGSIVFVSGFMDIEEYRTLRHEGALTFRVVIPGCLLNAGRYSVDVSAHYPNISILFQHETCVVFTVESNEHIPGGYGYPRKGILRPKLKWEIVSDGSS